MTPETLQLLLLGMACGYTVKTLLLAEKHGHEGPFKTPKHFVIFPDTSHVQKVSMFDWIRRIFGVYEKVEKKGDGNTYWMVDLNASERWTCPFCLSFWMAIPFSLFQFLVMNPEQIHWIPFYHLVIATIAVITYGQIERAMSGG